MSLFNLFVGVVVVGVAISIIVVEKVRGKKHETIEMFLRFHWFWGNLQHFVKYEDRMHDEIYNSIIKESKRKEKTKIICASFPEIANSGLNIYLCEPKLVKYVFETKFEDFGKSNVVHDTVYEIFGDGIFSVDPPKWKFHRKVASRMFSLRNLRNYMFDCAVRNCNNLINKMIELSDNNNFIDIFDLFGRFTLDCFVESAFGESIDCIGKAPKMHEFGNAFDKMTELCDKRFIDPFWKIKKYFKIGERERKLIPYYNKIIDSTIYDIIESRKVCKKNIFVYIYFVFFYYYILIIGSKFNR